ncbi:hypothetical protein [Roseovarius sp. MMSF_3281]|uniref:hypothetical protein n=1 Tax=Roseovarius sp. MMSF_3281 TaxID=3046694 RepID=UPI00273D4460|nr:hypothetical protein [Roseovarius sp. MMSF_3281]
MKKVLVPALAGLGLLTLAACDIPPEGTTPENIAEYEIAVASIGCELVGESDYLPVEFQAGLTREQSTAITSYMLTTGKAERLPDSGVKLTTGACA